MKALPWQIVSFLLAALLIIAMITCSRRSDLSTGQVTTTRIIGDTGVKQSVLPAPVAQQTAREDPEIKWYPVYRDTGSTKWRYYDVDTLAILRDYLSVKTYKRILKNDSVAFVQLDDTVSQNRLRGSKLTFQLFAPIKIERTTTTIAESQSSPIGFYAGITSGILNDRIGFGPALEYVHSNYSYSFAYDGVQRLKSITIKRRIWKPKKVP